MESALSSQGSGGGGFDPITVVVSLILVIAAVGGAVMYLRWRRRRVADTKAVQSDVTVNALFTRSGVSNAQYVSGRSAASKSLPLGESATTDDDDRYEVAVAVNPQYYSGKSAASKSPPLGESATTNDDDRYEVPVAMNAQYYSVPTAGINGRGISDTADDDSTYDVPSLSVSRSPHKSANRPAYAIPTSTA